MRIIIFKIVGRYLLESVVGLFERSSSVMEIYIFRFIFKGMRMSIRSFEIVKEIILWIFEVNY